MAKYYGRIGFVSSTESQTSPGVWEDTPTERYYYGDIFKARRKNENSSGIVSNISVNNEISIVADDYINSNIGHMRYVEFMNTFWDIDGVELQYPRITITMGGVYNGPTCGPSV